MKQHGLETVRCTTHFNACDCREAYVAELEKQLAEARDALIAVRDAVPGTDDAAYQVQRIVSEALAGEE